MTGSLGGCSGVSAVTGVFWPVVDLRSWTVVVLLKGFSSEFGGDLPKKDGIAMINYIQS